MARSETILDPADRFSEIMFGLIMALTFTCTISVATSSRNDVMTMLAAAISCNVAWGFVDGAMYILNQVIARRQQSGAAAAIAAAPARRAREIVLDRLPEAAGAAFTTADLDRIVSVVMASRLSEIRVHPVRDDLIGGAVVFLLVFLSTFPVALPFLVFGDVSVALRVSNGVAIVMLFVLGTRLARHIEWRPHWRFGAGVALFGAILVAVTIALGG